MKKESKLPYVDEGQSSYEKDSGLDLMYVDKGMRLRRAQKEGKILKTEKEKGNSYRYIEQN